MDTLVRGDDLPLSPFTSHLPSPSANEDLSHTFNPMAPTNITAHARKYLDEAVSSKVKGSANSISSTSAIAQVQTAKYSDTSAPTSTSRSRKPTLKATAGLKQTTSSRSKCS